MSTAILTGGELEASAESLALPVETDEALYEFLDGQRVAMPPMSIRAVTVVGRLFAQLNAFVTSNRLGEAFTEMLIAVPVPGDEDRNRRPDVCFVSSSALARAVPEDPDANAWNVVPDLVVEVTSPTDRAEDQREKVVEYHQLGVRCVWVVYPKLRVVDVYDSSGSLRTFGPEGNLTGDPVLPGFQVNLGELFSPIGSPPMGD
jgi:Uma2 family endonuclease